MSEKLTPKRLAELVAANLPVATMGDIGLTPAEDVPDVAALERLSATINGYLSVFAAPQKSDRGSSFVYGDSACLCCGESLAGMLGTFTFGMAWGEGYCRVCEWPCRALHSIKFDGDDVFSPPLSCVLQYHPSQVRLPAEVEA